MAPAGKDDEFVSLFVYTINEAVFFLNLVGKVGICLFKALVNTKILSGIFQRFKSDSPPIPSVDGIKGLPNTGIKRHNSGSKEAIKLRQNLVDYGEDFRERLSFANGVSKEM